MLALEEAFRDNEAPAAAIDCDGPVVSVVMRFPDRDSIVPADLPARDSLHTQALLSHALATAREAFATAPGIERVQLLCLSESRTGLRPVYAAIYRRTDLDRIDWRQPSGSIIGRLGGRLAPSEHDGLSCLRLGGEPDLLGVAQVVADALGSPLDPEASKSPPDDALDHPQAEASFETMPQFLDRIAEVAVLVIAQHGLTPSDLRLAALVDSERSQLAVKSLDDDEFDAQQRALVDRVRQDLPTTIALILGDAADNRLDIVAAAWWWPVVSTRVVNAVGTPIQQSPREQSARWYPVLEELMTLVAQARSGDVIAETSWQRALAAD